jgi:hypothetical protein
MGLDMSLEKRTGVREWDEGGKPRLRGSLAIAGIDPDKVTTVIEEVGSWRKANAIHRWFVEGVGGGIDECQSIPVTADELEELLRRVEAVLAHPELAERILPTQEGFFFGSIDYDEGYFDDLRETVTLLTWALADADAEFIASSVGSG